MTENEEESSAIILRAIDVILIKNPERTALGVLFGAVLIFLSSLFSPVLKEIKIIDISSAPKWGWIAIGILLSHFRIFLRKLFRKTVIDDEIDKILMLIGEGNFSKVEKRQLYRKVVNQFLVSLRLDKDFRGKIDTIKKDLINPPAKSS